eukprot:CAMPEP_0185737984 /NCGR_PEP_ID=MMETSP1171-20130828/31755_1 /TAXON_ID=374046 /ORGANISM="Helicotheca tamensis, Strain CCMP826" /LENGTH=56 /DNA_ID=CAMNT_0028409057 /DNA_START=225 /DNA_END=395 /DNA_ORIENTATION=+
MSVSSKSGSPKLSYPPGAATGTVSYGELAVFVVTLVVVVDVDVDVDVEEVAVSPPP